MRKRRLTASFFGAYKVVLTPSKYKFECWNARVVNNKDSYPNERKINLPD